MSDQHHRITPPDDQTGDQLDAETFIRRARELAFTLYEGKRTPHRSCGIAIAETFGLATEPYQALRKGGITGCGECGAIVAGRLVLGQLLGDPDPTGQVTPALREAMLKYESLWAERLERRDASGSDIACNTLAGQFDVFMSEERAGFCTRIAAMVAESTAEALASQGKLVNVRLNVEGVEE
ncbi:MAG: hypothetical protein KC561_01150 [Myxococcales bacterium]|nr:hypothetical protein [Myxococcales bacterium]